MRTLTLRASKDPTKPTSYAIFFSRDDKLVASWTTKNGSILELGRLAQAWVLYDLLPSGADKKVEGLAL